MGDAPTTPVTAASTRKPQILPVDNATTPYWRTDLHAIDSHRSTEELPSGCDIVIIGAGMAGVCTAYHIVKQVRESSGVDMPSIVLLDARRVCEGATGRNGGHVKVKSDTLMNLIEEFGLEAAMEFRDLVAEQIYALKDVVEKEGLDCEFELRRSYDVFIDSEEAEGTRKKFQSALGKKQKWTRDVALIGETSAEQVTSIKGAKLALSVPACSMWPYKFVSQLLARLVEEGNVNLQTNTPVTRIVRANGTNVVRTDRGMLKAKKVVFATNAYTAGILSQYTDTIVPYKGTAVHITPESPVSPHLSNTYNIHYPIPNVIEPVDYLNPRPDGSIVVGGGKWTYADDQSRWYNVWDDSTLLEETVPHFDGLMQRNFRGWDGSQAVTDMMWTGIMGLTPDGVPHVGEVPDTERSQFILAGFNGGGNALIFLTAQGLAKMMLEGVPFEKTGLPRLFKTSRDRLSGR